MKTEALYRQKIIEHGFGAWCAAVHLARKKDGTWRYCIDYCKLNAITILDAYPVPNIEMMFNELKGARFFSKIDLTDGYWHIPIREKDREKTGFATRQGVWQWRCMLMGLKNSSFTFQRVMQNVLRKHLWNPCMVYIDDIIIYNKMLEEHMEHVQSVLQTLADAKFDAKISKCKFLASKIDFLGHIITGLKLTV